MSRTLNPRSPGFTLLELLVAISVFAVLSVIAYGGLFSVLNTGEQVRGHRAQLEQLQMAEFWLSQDLQQIAARPIRDENGEVRGALILASDQATLEFTRTGRANPAGWARSNLQRVAYRLEEGQLIRHSWGVLDRAQDSASSKAVLLDDVTSLHWQFLNQEFQWVEDWEETSQANAAPTLPQAIALTLETRRWGPIERLFELPSGLPSNDETQ